MILLKSPRVALAASLFALAAGTAAAEGSPVDESTDNAAPLATIRAFMAAFNDHDPKAMKAMLAPDAAWYSVAGADLVAEAGDRDELIEGMKRYFADVPDVHATVEEPVVDGSRVAFRERVTWRGGTRAQTALAVYHVEGGRISSAWYFPAAP